MYYDLMISHLPLSLSLFLSIPLPLRIQSHSGAVDVLLFLTSLVPYNAHRRAHTNINKQTNNKRLPSLYNSLSFKANFSCVISFDTHLLCGGFLRSQCHSRADVISACSFLPRCICASISRGVLCTVSSHRGC